MAREVYLGDIIDYIIDREAFLDDLNRLRAISLIGIDTLSLSLPTLDIYLEFRPDCTTLSPSHSPVFSIVIDIL